MSDEREELAKIIDPQAWSLEWISTRRRDKYCADTLDLADKIIAAGYHRQPAVETVTEWGTRYSDSQYVQRCETAADARQIVCRHRETFRHTTEPFGIDLVSRTVSAWRPETVVGGDS